MLGVEDDPAGGNIGRNSDRPRAQSGGQKDAYEKPGHKEDGSTRKVRHDIFLDPSSVSLKGAFAKDLPLGDNRLPSQPLASQEAGASRSALGTLSGSECLSNP